MSKHRDPPPSAVTLPPAASGPAPRSRTDSRTLAALVASAFARAGVTLRLHVLRRLLGAVGPLGLAVIGGGAFAKYLASGRWRDLPVSLDDAARATWSQVFELVRYVEQSDPAVAAQVAAALARDTTVMAALGASVAALIAERVRAHRGDALPR
jgi:hypothetical protein